MNPENDVIFAALRLSRSLRRCPPPRPERHPFPPAVGRLLACVAENPGISSRDLCELLDLRPSSLSEFLSRAESEGLLTRTPDEEDRRMQHVHLSQKGQSFLQGMEAERAKDAAEKAACFTDEEKAQFCALCNKLSSHLESLADHLPDRPPRPDFPDGPDHSRRFPRRPMPGEGRIRC